jgi:CHAT domain-containing protein
VKRLALIAIIALSVLAAAVCTHKDTQTTDVWVRPVEPMLTGATQWQPCRAVPEAGRVLAEVQCGVPEPAARSSGDCDTAGIPHAAVLQMLVSRPRCIDAAIAELEFRARSRPALLSDVAAAYYLRAQREDQPADLLPALDAARRAADTDPGSKAARFNLALIQEAMGFSEEAARAWDQLRKGDDLGWGTEARAHSDRLERERRNAAYVVWPRTLEQLPKALGQSNHDEVARLVGPFPLTAQLYLEETVLGDFAEAPSPQTLGRVKLLADVLSRRSGDAYLHDLVEASAQAMRSPERLAALRDGHRAFREAKRAQRVFDPADAPFRRAAKLLANAESPLRIVAQLGMARSTAQGPNGSGPAVELLNSLEKETRTRAWRHLNGRVLGLRAYCRFYESRYAESLADDDAAIVEYGALHDEESAAPIQTRRIGALRVMGQSEEAWRQAVQSNRLRSRIVDPQERHLLLGETAKSALLLGSTRIAFLYQDLAVRTQERDLALTPPEQLVVIRKHQRNLAIALRERAAIEVRLDDYTHATIDLAAAKVRDEKEAGIDPNVRRLIDARVNEVQGQALLATEPGKAATAFTKALQSAEGDEYQSFRAALLAQRAEAHRLAGNRFEAESDLRAALEELRQEQTRILGQREPGRDKTIWSSYFGRFQETYRLLIHQLVDQNQMDEAFRYAEEARAFEPLNLIRRLGAEPAAFHALTAGGRTIPLDSIRASLEPGTFVLEYCVLQENTYVWILSRESFRFLKLRASRDDVRRWTAAVQRAAARRDGKLLDAGLYAPYERLVAEPLGLIRHMSSAHAPFRLVFIPDDAMHGLPFSALRDRRSGLYLVEEAPIETAGSAALYLYSLFRDRDLKFAGDVSIALLGDPAFDERLPSTHGLPRLQGARSEVEKINDLYVPHAAMRVGAEATVPVLLDLAPKSTIIHIAAHALANAHVPSLSLLLLAPSAHQRGELDAKALLSQLRVPKTRLMVLSACSSGGGLPIGPEGVAPLVRPLLAAGVPAVLGTLWDINDATSADLLVAFHQHYRQGSDAAVALQQAQLQLLRDNDKLHQSPLTWAPFQVFGHASSPYARPP